MNEIVKIMSPSTPNNLLSEATDDDIMPYNLPNSQEQKNVLFLFNKE